MGRSHGGWYLQQLVKLGASRYLPGLSDTFMVWDPDMIPLWPVTVFGERSATNGGKRKVFRQVGGYVIRSYEVSLFLVIFGYFWLFLLVIFGYFWLFLVISLVWERAMLLTSRVLFPTEILRDSDERTDTVRPRR